MNGFGNAWPILRLTVNATNSADDRCVHAALIELAGRDQSIKIDSRSEATAYTLTVKSKLHLESICDRLR